MTMVYFWFHVPGLPLLLRKSNASNDPGEEDVFVGVLREGLVDTWLYKVRANKREEYHLSIARFVHVLLV
jgi:hypothetical protein